jgi:hypothetical protein
MSSSRIHVILSEAKDLLLFKHAYPTPRDPSVAGERSLRVTGWYHVILSEAKDLLLFERA